MRAREDRFQDGEERGGTGLLDTRLEEIGGLEEDGAGYAGGQAGEEVEIGMRPFGTRDTVGGAIGHDPVRGPGIRGVGRISGCERLRRGSA